MPPVRHRAAAATGIVAIRPASPAKGAPKGRGALSAAGPMSSGRAPGSLRGREGVAPQPASCAQAAPGSPLQSANRAVDRILPGIFPPAQQPGAGAGYALNLDVDISKLDMMQIARQRLDRGSQNLTLRTNPAFQASLLGQLNRSLGRWNRGVWIVRGARPLPGETALFAPLPKLGRMVFDARPGNAHGHAMLGSL
jgi:hypothetical protein